ncbi:hypothetical protein M413DRAFT_28620 [Hebeloma cylindrosporum]|uniref:DUF1168-domain-containing protein n=1 Tax=Hebeloma cylindrosporum TaxID=76867 RepID=A0A0C2XR90_HEBCY|nr:hypothetical protein M413DRAFT_28620 [Hebeloma cylindrosporum h7]
MSQSETSNPKAPVNRHAMTAVEKQRLQLEKLLKDPIKPAFIPPPPKEKTIRPAREMMKNVQGSSAGAGSGEFHVYKASRRREYERLKLLEEASLKETEDMEFERKRREKEESANIKTDKNRAKRQKKKERSKMKSAGAVDDDASREKAGTSTDIPIKKRRLVNGKELVFKRPGEEIDSDVEEEIHPARQIADTAQPTDLPVDAPPVLEPARITIVEEE